MDTSDLILREELRILRNIYNTLYDATIVEAYNKLAENKNSNWDYHYWLGVLSFLTNSNEERVRIYSLLKYNNSCLTCSVYYTQGFMDELRKDKEKQV